MAKKAIVELELQTDSYKASLVEIQKGNTTISESASKAAQTAQAAFTETGKAAKAAFASTEVKKALTDQTAGIDKLAASLQKLIQEQVDLLAAGKKQSDEFKKNQAEIARVNGEIAKLTKQTEQLATAEDKTVKKSQTLTGQLRAMKQELALLEQEGKDGTAQFNQLSLAAARLEDQIGDTRERVRVLASDTFVFDAAVDSVNALAGGFAAAQGVIGLFADDSESLQKAIAKTNSALAILNGLQQVSAFVTGQSAGKLALLNAAQRINVFVTGAATAATKAWRAALVATGLGALIVLLGTLASKFFDVGEATTDAADKAREYQKVLEELQRSADSAQRKFGNAQIEQLRLQGKITEEQAKRLTEFNNLNQQIVDNNISAKEKETEAFKRFEEQKAEDLKTFGKVTKTTSEQLYKDLANIEAERALNEKAIRVNAQNEIIKDQQERAKKAADAAKQAAEKQKQLERDVAKESREIALKLEKENAEFSLAIRTKLEADWQKELDRLREIQRKREEARAASFETINEDFYDGQINRLKTLEAEEGSTSERRIKLLELDAQKQISQIRLTAENTVAGTAKANNQIMLIEAETQAAIRAERQRTKDESIRLAFQYAQEFSDVLTSLNELSRQNTENQIADIERRQAVELEAINNSLDTERQKERQRSALTLRTNQKIAAEKTKQAKQDKALAIFNATIQTAQAIVGFLANPGGIPGIALSVLAGITGAAQIAAISSRPIPKFEKGGKVGGKRHSQGGTLIEAEVDEFVTRRGQSIRHRSELEAINRSTAEYHRLIQRNYVRPAIARVLADRKQDKPTFNLNATLNSKKMEGELKGLRKDIRRSKQRNYTNQTDSRYQWHNN
jgi:hypothetical protein